MNTMTNGYMSHWCSIAHTMVTKKKKKKTKHPCGHMFGEMYSTVQWSAHSLKVGKWTQCAVSRKQVDGIWYVWVLVCSLFSSCTVITQLRLTARLFPSSTLPLSLDLLLSHSQVCDFMYNYLHNYSSLHPTVPGGLFLSHWYRLSFFFLNTHPHTQTVPVLAPYWFSLPFCLVLRLVLSLSFVMSLSEAGLF